VIEVRAVVLYQAPEYKPTIGSEVMPPKLLNVVFLEVSAKSNTSNTSAPYEPAVELFAAKYPAHITV
jgi:hypothetical protein